MASFSRALKAASRAAVAVAFASGILAAMAASPRASAAAALDSLAWKDLMQ
jgi:hypothetical protein